MAARILQSNGYVVAAAGNAEEAISLFSQGSTPALLFTDVILPGRSGIELAEEVSALAPAMPILLTSGYADTRLRMDTVVTRGWRLLAKPYPPGTLLREVYEAMHAAFKTRGDKP
jgi:DNA-binding NtrC family response regulator